MKYLVVDDSKLARLSIIKSLKTCNDSAEVLQAENGLEALNILKDEKPSVVFLDLTMPIMDGYEALEEIMKVAPQTKVIVVSADIQMQAKEKVINLGAQLHVQKPISAEKMQEILETI